MVGWPKPAPPEKTHHFHLHLAVSGHAFSFTFMSWASEISTSDATCMPWSGQNCVRAAKTLENSVWKNNISFQTQCCGYFGYSTDLTVNTFLGDYFFSRKWFQRKWSRLIPQNISACLDTTGSTGKRKKSLSVIWVAWLFWKMNVVRHVKLDSFAVWTQIA